MLYIRFNYIKIKCNYLIIKEIFIIICQNNGM